MNKRSTNPRNFLTEEERSAVRVAIEKSEKTTSAELKLVLVRHCWGDKRRKARKLFLKLNLDKTADRNCVLIMLVITNRQFLIYGDEGIHTKVGQNFWDDVRDRMTEHFRSGEFGVGLCAGIDRVGEKLAQYFPGKVGDKDELSNDIEYA